MNFKQMISVLGLMAISSFAGGYGTAGCGGGSMLFGEGDGFGQVFAATTNGSSFSQYFGMSSGTSNCAADGVVMKEKETEFFAEANMESLSREFAQGEGETISVLANLMGCGMDVATFTSSVQSNYSAVFTSGSETEAQVMIQNLQKVIEQGNARCNEHTL